MNCSFNIRYKPRTTRQFTKSDLTVYDSADNTALNALTVYGKSEVVDGAITSAGEGWSTVDLGTLTWTYTTSQAGTPMFISNDAIGAKAPYDYDTVPNILCAKYPRVSWSALNIGANPPKAITIFPQNASIRITDTDYTDATAFKNSLNGVILAYQLADPTQGNAIAVKTDNGSGIDGTMATFSTGTPLRGIPDTTVRDVMAWDGNAGEVTKNCAKVRLADLTWYSGAGTSIRSLFGTSPINDAQIVNSRNDVPTFLCSNKISKSYNEAWTTETITQDTTGVILCTADPTITTIEDFVASLGDAELVYELATPTTEQLTSPENASIAGLRTFTPQTHVQNNAQTEMTIDYTIRVPTI